MLKQKSLNQKGQGMIEYVILVALIAIFCMTAVGNLGKKVNAKIEQIDKNFNGRVVVNGDTNKGMFDGMLDKGIGMAGDWVKEKIGNLF